MICANPHCGREFESKPRGAKGGGIEWTRHCSSKCWHVVRVSRGINTDMNAARLGRMYACRERLAEKFVQEFGALTPRDVRLIRMAYKRGYMRAYNRIREEPHRTKVA